MTSAQATACPAQSWSAVEGAASRVADASEAMSSPLRSAPWTNVRATIAAAIRVIISVHPPRSDA
jgi:hypothetical protein